jgi:hypothetical protein
MLEKGLDTRGGMVFRLLGISDIVVFESSKYEFGARLQVVLFQSTSTERLPLSG